MLRIRYIVLVAVFFLLISCEEKPRSTDATDNIYKSISKEPLVIESMFDLRTKLTEISNRGGLDGIKKYLTKEFITQRAIEVDGKSSRISGFQLKYLTEGKPGDVIVDYNPTAKNSRLLVIVNLVDIVPNLQPFARVKAWGSAAPGTRGTGRG